MHETFSRNTKYTESVMKCVQDFGHATNAQILDKLHESFPELSATTVHRITCRLASRGLIGIAPSAPEGAMRYDARSDDHDHFACDGCGGLRDIDVAHDIIPLVSEALGGCEITGRLVINGQCTNCIKGSRK